VVEVEGVVVVWEDKLVFKRKSCVIAMPIEAKEREVRSQAKNVRSISPFYQHISLIHTTPSSFYYLIRL